MKSVTKFCRKCKQMLPVSEFGKKTGNRDGLFHMCKTCRNAYRREYHRRNPEINKAAKKRDYEKRKETILQQQREWYRSGIGRRYARNRFYQQKFGITIEQYEEILASQDGVCAICQSTEKGARYKSLAVDHDHDTGVVRGLLCQACNRGIGLLGDDIDRLNKAVTYLNNHRFEAKVHQPNAEQTTQQR